MADSDPYIEVQRHGRVAVLRLSRPDRLNALGADLARDALEALEGLETDRDVGALVLAGAGRAFSAGGDLVEMAPRLADGDLAERLAMMRGLQALVVALRETRLATVAAVSGVAYGAGWSLALACDLVVAAEDARFCQVFVERGLVPDLGSAWLLTRAVGALRAKELMLLGEEVDAAQAHEWGLVNRLAPDRDAAESAARDLAARLADRPPAAVAMTKKLVDRSQASTFEDSLALEEHAQALALDSAETKAALDRFLGRSRGGRPPGDRA